MKIQTTFVVGGVSYTVDVDEDNPKEALHQAIAISNPRSVCNVCGATGLENKTLSTNRTKDGFVYIKCECECGAKSTMGEYRTGGYFWHEYEVWKPDYQDNDDGQQAAPAMSARELAGSNASNRTQARPTDPISPKGLDALNEKLSVLMWEKSALQGWLESEYGVTQLQALSQDQGRDAYRKLDALVRAETPF